MYKMLTLIIASLSLSACVAEGQFVSAKKDNRCDGKGQADLRISYGDSLLDVTPKVNVKQDGEIIVKLKPEKGYESIMVTLHGKNDDNTDDWLDMTVKASDFKPGENPYICVHEQPLGTYEYYVEVETVGKLDPRIKVLPN